MQMRGERLHTTRALPHQRVADVLGNVRWATSQHGLYRSSALRKTRLHDAFGGSDRVLLLELAILGEFWEIPEILFLKRDHQGRSSLINKTKAEMAAWLDPMRKEKNSQKRIIVEFVRSIARFPLAPGERLLCFWTALFVWSKRRLLDRHCFELLKGTQAPEVPIEVGHTRKYGY